MEENSCVIQAPKRRPAKSHGISVSLQKWTMISRSHGNVTKSHGINGICLILYFIFLHKKHAFGVNPRGFLCVNPRNADHRDLKLAPHDARTTFAS